MLIKLVKNDYSIVFPQANDIYKVIKFVDERTYNYYSNTLRIEKLEFVPRQMDYYKNAAIYLGLFESDSPSSLAMHLFKLDKDQLFINLVQLILQHEVFFSFFINRDKTQTKNYLISYYKMNEVTANRRASTVANWIKWCDAIIKENHIKVEVFEDGHR